MVSENILNGGDRGRFYIGIVGALCVHILVFALLVGISSSRTIIAADTYSAPTNVSIRFVKPIEINKPAEPEIQPVKSAAVIPEKSKPVIQKLPIKKTIPKPLKKNLPEDLNKVEPAAYPPPQASIKPVQREPVQIQKAALNVVPVTSEIRTKGRRVQPEYPERSLRLRQEGVVWLRVLVSETGQKQEIKIHDPSRYAPLNMAAIRAVKKWEFEPYIDNGRAVKRWIEIPIEFKIR